LGGGAPPTHPPKKTRGNVRMAGGMGFRNKNGATEGEKGEFLVGRQMGERQKQSTDRKIGREINSNEN